MAAGCCFLWCMRYNPSQATRLLLDPLNLNRPPKWIQISGGLCIQAPGKSRHLLLNVLLDTSHPFFFTEVRISSVKPSLPPASLTTKQPNKKFELGHKSNLNQQSVPPQDDR